jgi:hypothetical protein
MTSPERVSSPKLSLNASPAEVLLRWRRGTLGLVPLESRLGLDVDSEVSTACQAAEPRTFL